MAAEVEEVRKYESKEPITQRPLLFTGHGSFSETEEPLQLNFSCLSQVPVQKKRKVKCETKQYIHYVGNDLVYDDSGIRLVSVL